MRNNENCSQGKNNNNNSSLHHEKSVLSSPTSNNVVKLAHEPVTVVGANAEKISNVNIISDRQNVMTK